ncbi:hypothetical protein [Rhizobium mesosinicum]|uniref:hypothetical protein n=1 Tax=Rhizobium mesosinicum TaxID=335017 RepID=UPI001CB78AFD|nr:hypothetical protein [Rhizobium mesosinicum]
MGDSRNYLGLNIYMSLLPGLAIMVTTLGFNILGDGRRPARSAEIKRDATRSLLPVSSYRLGKLCPA